MHCKMKDLCFSKQLLLISLCSVRYQKLQINCNETSIDFTHFWRQKDEIGHELFRTHSSSAFYSCCQNPIGNGVAILEYDCAISLFFPKSSHYLHSPFPFFLLFPLFYLPQVRVQNLRQIRRGLISCWNPRYQIGILPGISIRLNNCCRVG